MSATETTTSRDGLSRLAEEINEAHRGVVRSNRQSVMHALRAGALLNEAKGSVGHGKWGAWLKENFEGSTRTAQVYMRLANHAEEAQRIAHLGLAGVVRALSAQPPDGFHVMKAARSEKPAERSLVLGWDGILVPETSAATRHRADYRTPGYPEDIETVYALGWSVGIRHALALLSELGADRDALQARLETAAHEPPPDPPETATSIDPQDSE
jgi:Protein of unknown function (DUF3102)